MEKRKPALIDIWGGGTIITKKEQKQEQEIQLQPPPPPPPPPQPQQQSRQEVYNRPAKGKRKSRKLISNYLMLVAFAGAAFEGSVDDAGFRNYIRAMRLHKDKEDRLFSLYLKIGNPETKEQAMHDFIESILDEIA